MSHAHWAVIENLPDAVIVMDGAAAPVYLNAAARRLGEPRPHASISLTQLLNIDAAGAEPLENAVGAVLRGSQAEAALESTTRDGRRLSMTIVSSNEGGARGALVVCRERAARAEDASRERLEHLLEATAEGVCLHDGRIVVEANRAMAEAFGYGWTEIIGVRVDALLAPAPGEDLAAHLGQDSVHTFEATALRKGKGSFSAEVVSKPVGAREHGIHGLTIRDVTAHRATAQAFHDSEERFRLVSELSTEGLVLTERGVIFHVNDAMTKIFGYNREELIGMPAIDLTAPEDRELAVAHIRSGSEEPYEARGVRKDGSTFVGSISGTNLPYQDRMVRGSRMTDISAQREADEGRRKSIIQEEKLRIQEERLAEMSTPLISISKEIIAMPLVGTMDVARARQALKAMLEGISRTDAHTAIVDITGMSGVDTNVVASLVRLAQAVRLQGAQVVLTGIRPQVADTLVTLDANLTGIVIKGSFQDGIRYAMKRGKASRMAVDLD